MLELASSGKRGRYEETLTLTFSPNLTLNPNPNPNPRYEEVFSLFAGQAQEQAGVTAAMYARQGSNPRLAGPYPDWQVCYSHV